MLRLVTLKASLSSKWTSVIYPMSLDEKIKKIIFSIFSVIFDLLIMNIVIKKFSNVYIVKYLRLKLMNSDKSLEIYELSDICLNNVVAYSTFCLRLSLKT